MAWWLVKHTDNFTFIFYESLLLLIIFDHRGIYFLQTFTVE
jgi:hypothetical protein